MTEKKMVILAFGNPVRGDDAIGCNVIEWLKEDSEIPVDNISFFDMGTNGFEILFALPGHEKIIVVDAVHDPNTALGTIYKVPAEELLAAPEEDPLLYLHGMKWNQGLSYAKKIMGEEYPEDISAYLISIENTSMVEAMNSEVEAAGRKVVEYIKEEIKAWSN